MRSKKKKNQKRRLHGAFILQIWKDDLHFTLPAINTGNYMSICFGFPTWTNVMELSNREEKFSLLHANIQVPSLIEWRKNAPKNLHSVR